MKTPLVLLVTLLCFALSAQQINHIQMTNWEEDESI
jgi:hypothetical protein